MISTPSLRGYYGTTEDEWFARYIELFTPPGVVEPARAVQITTVAGALVGATKALVAVWVAPPDADMEAITSPTSISSTPSGPTGLPMRPL